VFIQVMLKGRDEQLSRLKTYEQYILYTTTTDEQQQQHKVYCLALLLWHSCVSYI